jgi:hypothetical protein
VWFGNVLIDLRLDCLNLLQSSGKIKPKRVEIQRWGIIPSEYLIRPIGRKRG